VAPFSKKDEEKVNMKETYMQEKRKKLKVNKQRNNLYSAETGNVSRAH